MWLQPSFFCIGDLQLEQGFELVTSHRQLAEFSSASSVPDTIHNAQYKILCNNDLQNVFVKAGDD